MAFEGLSEKLQHIFSKLTNRGKLTEVEVKAAMREIKLVLLEADVNFKVVKSFIQDITDRAVGEEVLKSLTPGQQVVKIVRDELVKILGEKTVGVNFASNPPTIIMMCGLQGSGKTTMCGKLAKMWSKDRQVGNARGSRHIQASGDKTARSRSGKRGRGVLRKRPAGSGDYRKAGACRSA